MPTASKPGGQSRGLPSVFSQQGGGAGSPVAALVAQQQEQQAQFQKLLQTIEKLQQENAAAVQQAAQAGAGAATQVANQVAQGIQRSQQEQQRGQERAEDRAFAEDMQRLNVKLQEEASKEAALMGQAIQGQREAIMRFRDQFHGKKAEIQESIAAYDARTDEMLAAGWFSSPKGREELRRRKHLIDMIEANADDHFDDRHLAKAYELHNENVQALIQGDDAMDLSRLRVEPLQLPMPQVKKSGKRVAGPDELDPQTMFELKLSGGYPPEGVVFNDKPNFGMPEGYSPRMLDADTVLEAMSRDDFLRFATDQSLRQELDRKNQELVVRSMDRLVPMKEQYDNFNKTFNPMAPVAVQTGIENFLALDNPHKFDDIGRIIMSESIKEIFGGGSKGEKMSVMALEIFDGKRELTTPEEAFAAMALESATFNIKQHMMSEFMSVDTENGSLATELVNQMVDELGEEEAALALGVAPTAVGLVRAQEVMQGRLAESYAFANRMNQGLKKSSVLESFLQDYRKHLRLADLYAFRTLKEGEDKQRRVLDLLSQEETLSRVTDQLKGATPEEVSSSATRDASKVEAGLNMLDSMVMIANEMGPDTVAEVATFVTGGLEPLDTPNLQAYLDQTLVEKQRSGFAKAAADRAGFNQKRQMRARQARVEQEKTTGQSFEEGGVPGVLREKVPALVGLAGSSIRDFTERTAAGLVQLTAGKEATRDFAEFVRQPPRQASPEILDRQIGDITRSARELK